VAQMDGLRLHRAPGRERQEDETKPHDQGLGTVAKSVLPVSCC
jgi:hypothetical protein